MGASNRQFAELFSWLLIIYVIIFISDFFVTQKYGQIVGFVAKMIPFSIFLIYLSFRVEQKFQKKVKKDE